MMVEILTVDISCMYSIPAKRFCSADVDRYVSPTNRCEDTQCIPRGFRERGIAVDGADAEEAERGVVSGEEDCEGILSCSSA